MFNCFFFHFTGIFAIYAHFYAHILLESTKPFNRTLKYGKFFEYYHIFEMRFPLMPYKLNFMWALMTLLWKFCFAIIFHRPLLFTVHFN